MIRVAALIYLFSGSLMSGLLDPDSIYSLYPLLEDLAAAK